MDDDVAGLQLLSPAVGQAEPVSAQVEFQHFELVGHELGKRCFAQFLLQAFEGRTGKHLLLEAVGSRPSGAGAYGQVDAADLRYGAKDLLDDRLAEEAGGTSDENRLAFEGLSDQPE